MDVVYGRIRDIVNPDAYVVAVKIGDIIIIREYDPKKLLKKIWKKFEDMSDKEKIQVALEAKKWAREK
ncbi:MAG: hypothetical protein Q6363_008745 [Candidatus Njordarchaeota archaeon]